ncbi:methyltransferase family protein [Scopulibacillus darangshiensis]|uniref:Methyltransferase family protein n=1 Tax=Scopulibacillus darangshiensis TaxID=442528 RepID=A0A4R2P8I1_9BACL|nr:class I SAM-dependent methyltransferase [Scopulibacillus darangshiensis]TCP31147.1 methyltransferase family protein [Scopulibacillus darangshiensis]
MENKKYLNFLAKLGISSAHPGGRPLTEALMKRETIGRNDRVLDVGCGAGDTSAYLTEHVNCLVTAVDFHPEMIKLASEKAKELNNPFDVIQADAQKLPFAEGSFDRVLSESVTAFTEIPVTLAEYYRVLANKGSLLAIEMTTERELSKPAVKEIQSVYGIQDLYTENEWVTALHDAGFSEVDVFRGDVFVGTDQMLSEVSSFKFSEKLDVEAFEVWMDHIRLMQKYEGVLGYRIYKAIK